MKILVNTVAEIGIAAKAVRKTQGVRQDDLGFMAGCSHKFIVDVEKGKKTVQTGLLLELLSELGIDVYLDIPDSALNRLAEAGLIDQETLESHHV
jgi:transcriptional regulator with XRE-family HTH domain